MNETQMRAADLLEIEILGAELSFGAAVADFLLGRTDEAPDARAWGLTEETGGLIAAEVLREDAVQSAVWYDEAATAYEAVLRIA